MRTSKFRERLTVSRAAQAALSLKAFETRPAEAACSAEQERFIPYSKLPDEGIPSWTRVHVRRLIARGLFPPPVMLSPNRIAWRLSDLAAWKASRPTAPIPVEAA